METKINFEEALVMWHSLDLRRGGPAGVFLSRIITSFSFPSVSGKNLFRNLEFYPSLTFGMFKVFSKDTWVLPVLSSLLGEVTDGNFLIFNWLCACVYKWVRTCILVRQGECNLQQEGNGHEWVKTCRNSFSPHQENSVTGISTYGQELNFSF